MKPVPLKTKDDWAKFQCLRHFFGETAGDDPYLLLHLKDAIDQSIAEAPDLADNVGVFAETAQRLSEDQPFRQFSYGLFHLALDERPYDELFIHHELIRGLKDVAGYDKVLLLVTGLRYAITGGKPYTRKQQEHAAAARQFIDETAAKYTTANTELTILYV